MANILIIEDNVILRRTIPAMLEALNFNTQVANSGSEGIKMALANPPDLILCDFLMDDGDGFFVLEERKKFSSISSIPIVIMTGITKSATIEKIMESGADAYLIKPFKNKLLFETIDKFLPKKR